MKPPGIFGAPFPHANWTCFSG